MNKLYHFYTQKIYPKIKHIRGTTRLQKILMDIALIKEDKTTKSEEKDLFEEKWDNLIIIDACRQDFYEEETGKEGSRISKASATTEFIKKNFSEGDFSDYVYVASNPQFSDRKFKEQTGKKPGKVFHEIFKTFNTSWDDDLNTVKPKETIKDALTAKKLFQDKKLIIHFLPPHYPFIRKTISHQGIDPEQKIFYDSAWTKAEAKKISHEKVEEAYRDNIRYIDQRIESFINELEGKTILTSDHGNLVGEQGIYGHPSNRKEKPLKKVPYRVYEN